MRKLNYLLLKLALLGFPEIWMAMKNQMASIYCLLIMTVNAKTMF